MGIAGGTTKDSLDPGTLEDQVAMNISRQTRNCLTEIAPDGSLIGELAESFEASPDARVWTLRASQRGRVPQRQEPRRRGRRLFHQSSSRAGYEVGCDGDDRSDRGSQSRR